MLIFKHGGGAFACVFSKAIGKLYKNTKNDFHKWDQNRVNLYFDYSVYKHFVHVSLYKRDDRYSVKVVSKVLIISYNEQDGRSYRSKF